MAIDRIEKSITLKAPVGRVWKALADYKEFGAWFQCEVSAPFKVGAEIFARMVIEGAEHLSFKMRVLKMEENKLFVCEWPAYVEKTDLVLEDQPWLLMQFKLEEVSEGTRLTIIESGFDKLDESLREEAKRGNEGGWEFQLDNIKKYLDEHS